MILTNIPTKNKPEITNIEMDIDICKINNIYNLKIAISKFLNLDIDSLFIYTSKDQNDEIQLYQNSDLIKETNQIFYKIIKNACNVCLAKATIITGDCNFCKCKYCNTHRLPESHKCACIHTIKKDSYNDNYNKVMNGKCVAAMI